MDDDKEKENNKKDKKDSSTKKEIKSEPDKDGDELASDLNSQQINDKIQSSGSNSKRKPNDIYLNILFSLLEKETEEEPNLTLAGYLTKIVNTIYSKRPSDVKLIFWNYFINRLF